MGSAEKKVKDIMCSVGEYDLVDQETPLRDILGTLKKNYDMIQAGEARHKTFLVTDASGKIIGKLSIYDFIRGLVPEPAKSPEHSKMFSSLISSRALEVIDEVAETQQAFKWLHSTFSDLVKQEVGKKVKEVMSPVDPLLAEEDTINKAIYIMFKGNIRQPMVVKDGKIVGVVRLMDVYPELLQIAGEIS